MRIKYLTGSPVSFFAFQDIITALAGLLLVVMLIGAVWPKTVRPAAGAAAASPDDLHRLEERKQELQNLRRRLAQVSLAPGDEYQRRRMKARSAQRDVQTALTRRRAEKIQLENKLKSLQKQLAGATADEEILLQAQQKLQELERLYQDKLQRRKIVSTGNVKTIVLDCARSRWQWQSAGAPICLLGGETPDDPLAALAELKQKIAPLDPAQYRILIALRPSAGGFGEALRDFIWRHNPRLPVMMEPMNSETAGGFEL